MKNIIAFVIAVLCSVAQAQTCTTTIGPSTTSTFIDSAIGSASAGAVICLSSGDYLDQVITSRNPSSNITIRSASGRGATFSGGLNIKRSSNLIFKSLTLNSCWVNVDSGASPVNHDITLADNLIQADGTTGGSGRCTLTGGTNILLYGNTFSGGYRSDGFEGQLYITNSNAVTSSNVIAHNTFEGTGACGDGIQFTSDGGDTTVGPGNIFRNWVQGGCGSGTGFGAHVDAIQFVGGSNITVIGNYFENNTVNHGIYDGAINISITHNIYNGQNSGTQSFQIGGVQGMTFSHNTLKGIIGGIGSKAANSPNSSWVIENNIFKTTDWSTASSDQDEGCGSGCVFRYNIITSDSAFSIVATPTNTVTGEPSWVGGASPANWYGWKLNAGSPGKTAGNDSKDMGTLYYKRGPVTGVN